MELLQKTVAFLFGLKVRLFGTGLMYAVQSSFKPVHDVVLLVFLPLSAVRGRRVLWRLERRCKQ